jgi:Spy/CpxP family protein refolding chaperone
MRSLITVLAVAVGVWLPAQLPAQERAAGPGERLQDLKLTGEQETKIADIRKECKPKVQEAAKELRALVKEEVTKVGAVLTAEQKEKLKAYREERKTMRAFGLAERIANLQALDLTEAELAKIAEIRKTYRPKIHKALEGLRGILTDEQKKTREEGLKAGKKRSEVIASLNLTDAQKEKVEAVGQEVCALVREKMEKMRDVLTEGQREKLQEFKGERRQRVRDRMAFRIATLRELNLTDEQKSQIAEIRKEYRPKIQEAGNKLRAAVREEMQEILAVIKG